MRPGWKRINVSLPVSEYEAFRTVCETRRDSMNSMLRRMIRRVSKQASSTGSVNEPKPKRGPALEQAKAVSVPDYSDSGGGFHVPAALADCDFLGMTPEQEQEQ